MELGNIDLTRKNVDVEGGSVDTDEFGPTGLMHTITSTVCEHVSACFRHPKRKCGSIVDEGNGETFFDSQETVPS